MLYSFQQKNVLIIPLASVIHFNKKISGERLANLFEKYFDEQLACEEELQRHKKFCEKLLKKILVSQVVADFNCGKKSKQEFISETLSFLNLSHDKASDFESAWNSLLVFDKELLDVFDELIQLTEQGKSIYFIGNTNELHAQKVLDLFTLHSSGKLSFVKNLPKPVGALPLAISEASQTKLANNTLAPPVGTVYFCLSYAYKTLIEQPSGILTTLFTPFKSPSGLLTQLRAYLNAQGKTKKDILLVNPYKNVNSITKKLAQEIIAKDIFYSELRSSVSAAMPSLLAPPPSTESSSGSIEYIPLSAHP